MSGGKRMILQVTKRKCTGIPPQMLFAKRSSEFVLKKVFKNIDTGKNKILEKDIVA